MFVKFAVMKICRMSTAVSVCETCVSLRVVVRWLVVIQEGDKARYVDSDVFYCV